MGTVGKILSIMVLLGAVYVYVKLNKETPIPNIEPKWWGPGKSQKEDVTVKPFKINVLDKDIADLQYRLKHAIPFQPPLEDVNQNYGINTKLLEAIVDYWKNQYNWKQRQDFLNQFPQFKTNIQGLNIHFLHVKPKNVPKGVHVLPLLILHGWPGSVREFYEIIPHLTTPQEGLDCVFEVIAPSLPGFGFSDGAVRPGMGPAQMGQLFNKLMGRLGFKKYYIQGGDFGSAISQTMAVLYPQNIRALHRNVCFNYHAFPKLVLASFWPSLFFSEKEVEMNYPLGKRFIFNMLESGYMHLQATKPDTVGVGLRDSPVGLAAYIIEKFITWTNPSWKNLPDGGLTRKFTMDQLLDNVMIYWITRSITTSQRLYAEAMSTDYMNLQFDNIPVRIPTACNRFKYELMYSVESHLRIHNTQLIQLTDFEDGGHFAALEVPDVLAKDIFEFVRKVRSLPKENKES